MQAETPSLVSMDPRSISNWRKSNSLHILPVVEWKNKQCTSRQVWVKIPDQRRGSLSLSCLTHHSSNTTKHKL